jgi:hypothetical protein
LRELDSLAFSRVPLREDVEDELRASTLADDILQFAQLRRKARCRR